jgi:ribonuclease P protein component
LLLVQFRKSQRIVRSNEFTLILRKGSCAADGVLVLFAVVGDESRASRLGITIPKKTGNAVARNRWKRLIRESFRTQQDQLPGGYDYVVRPKKGAQPSWKEIQKSLPKLANKAVQRMT